MVSDLSREGRNLREQFHQQMKSFPTARHSRAGMAVEAAGLKPLNVSSPRLGVVSSSWVVAGQLLSTSAGMMPPVFGQAAAEFALKAAQTLLLQFL